MGVYSLLMTVTRQRRGCDLNLGPSAPESSMLTTRLSSYLWSVDLEQFRNGTSAVASYFDRQPSPDYHTERPR